MVACQQNNFLVLAILCAVVSSVVLVPETRAEQPADAVVLSDQQAELYRRALESIDGSEEGAENARTFLEAAIVVGDESEVLILSLGRTYQLAGDCTKAVELFDKSEHVPPTADVSSDEVEATRKRYRRELKDECSGVLYVHCLEEETKLSSEKIDELECGKAVDVEPGDYRIDASLGGVAVAVGAEVNVGQKEEVEISLQYRDTDAVAAEESPAPAVDNNEVETVEEEDVEVAEDQPEAEEEEPEAEEEMEVAEEQPEAEWEEAEAAEEQPEAEEEEMEVAEEEPEVEEEEPEVGEEEPEVAEGQPEVEEEEPEVAEEEKKEEGEVESKRKVETEPSEELEDMEEIVAESEEIAVYEEPPSEDALPTTLEPETTKPELEEEPPESGEEEKKKEDEVESPPVELPGGRIAWSTMRPQAVDGTSGQGMNKLPDTSGSGGGQKVASVEPRSQTRAASPGADRRGYGPPADAGTDTTLPDESAEDRRVPSRFDLYFGLGYDWDGDLFFNTNWLLNFWYLAIGSGGGYFPSHSVGTAESNIFTRISLGDTTDVYLGTGAGFLDYEVFHYNAPIVALRFATGESRGLWFSLARKRFEIDSYLGWTYTVPTFTVGFSPL